VRKEEFRAIFERDLLDTACHLYGFHQDELELIPGYEGCANLVYKYSKNEQIYFLRLSCRSDRNADEIGAELHFINYLAEDGVRAARPVPSEDGNLLETLQVRGTPLYLVSFIKGKGMRVPDNGYRYRDDAPIEEYFQNWGRVLGQMHALSRSYKPAAERAQRPSWFEIHQTKLAIDKMVPERFPVVRDQIHALLEEIRSLPRDAESFGLIHGDFNDGNFTVDYDNGNITVFDFDDCCTFWYVYELASAWEGGIGRAMFRDLAGRKAFMDHYMEQVMVGYNSENYLSDEWLGQIPLFVRLIQVEEFLHFVQYIDDSDKDMQARLGYLIKCIEDDIPYMGFFDTIFSPENPYSF